MKTVEDLVKEKLEEVIVLARSAGMGNNFFDIYLEDGTNVDINVNQWNSSSDSC